VSVIWEEIFLCDISSIILVMTGEVYIYFHRSAFGLHVDHITCFMSRAERGSVEHASQNAFGSYPKICAVVAVVIVVDILPVPGGPCLYKDILIHFVLRYLVSLRQYRLVFN
jgi:hypothetical protein